MVLSSMTSYCASLTEGSFVNRLAMCILVLVGGLSMVGCGTLEQSTNNVPNAIVHTEPTAITSLADCLKRIGVPLDESASGHGNSTSIGGVLGQGGIRVPHSVTSRAFEEALARCGQGDIQVAGTPIKNLAFRKRLTELARCLRDSGFDIPEPNISGKGEVFDTSRVDISSPRWKTSLRRCRSKGG